MLESKNISKCFGGQVVLQSVNIAVAPGEVVGIVGMNGSGKTTLLDILSGKICPDSGEVWVDGIRFVPGRTFTPRPPVFRCYQVPQLFYGLSVANNLLLGRWFLGGNHTAYDISLNNIAQNNLARTLSVGQRRRVILDWVRARIGQVKYFLLDEPAAGGDDNLVNLLIDILNVAREQRCGILLVEHRSGVLKNTCDRIVYLRNGVCSNDEPPNGLTVPQSTMQASQPDLCTSPRLAVHNFTVDRGGARVINMIDFQVNIGEIFAVTGSNGCGKSTLLHAIYGNPTCTVTGGHITSDGNDLTKMSMRERMTKGVHIMPQEGTLFPSMTVEEALRTSVEAACPLAWNAEATSRVRSEMPIIDRIWQRRCGLLSGGERRLISLARVLLIRPQIALLDEPLAGIDTDSSKRVVKLIKRLADNGAAVVVAEQVELLSHINATRSLILQNHDVERII